MKHSSCIDFLLLLSVIFLFDSCIVNEKDSSSYLIDFPKISLSKRIEIVSQVYCNE